ncbi:MAG: hypothetical protein ACI87O_002040 [Planctomycetota bacterium]|jgi:hypothetical protein
MRVLSTLLVIGHCLLACTAPRPMSSIGSHPLDIEIGASDYPFGDGIEIESVASSTGRIEGESVLTVRGTYDLSSRDSATLYLGTTSTSSAIVTPRSAVKNSSVIKKGAGQFVLEHTVPGPGYPHVTFYDLETGKPFGGSYFGSGDSLLIQKQLWYGGAGEIHND